MKKCSTMSLDFSLHTYCNMNCSFCFENKKNGIGIKDYKIDIERIRSLPDKAAPIITEKIQTVTDDTVEVLLYGGELLADELPDQLFQEYELFLNRIIHIIWNIRPDITIVPVIITNGIFSNFSRVESLISKFNAIIQLSYDATGRFNNGCEKEIWFNTFNHFFKRYPLFISISIKKTDIEAYIHGDEYFEKIPENIWIDVNQYVPNLNYQEYLPSDDDIYNFYKWCIDTNHFNISSVTELFQEKRSPCNPLTEFLFFPNLPGEKCWMYLCNMHEPFQTDEYFGEYKDYMMSGCPNMINDARKHKRGCLTCEYNNNCVRMCTLPYMFNEYKMSDTCPIYRIIKYIESDKNITENFNHWKNAYDSFNSKFTCGVRYEKNML